MRRPQREPDGELTERLRELAYAEGASLVGFADVGGLAPLPRAVVLAFAHSPGVFTTIQEMPTAAYYREYLELNQRLNAAAEAVARALGAAGHEVLVNPATQAQLDLATLAAPFAHKTAATRAGLGWVGKSALLVTRALGPAVRLTTVLTSAPLEVGTPVTSSECGSCRACETACPAGAIRGEEWHPGRPREEFFDAQACYREASARARARGMNHPVCGVCMLVCPRSGTGRQL